MRYAWIGFHLLMLLLLVLAFMGTFEPPRTGNFTRDASGIGYTVIGVVFLWIVGAIVFRVIRRFAKY
jgi:hypothetical protein